MLAAHALAGCAKDKAPQSLTELATRLDYTTTPRLPAPASGTYLSFEEDPRDELIARLVKGKRHDGALASAAASLALGRLETDAMLSRWSLREALWRGGFPYPVYDARSWDARAGDAPPIDLFSWIEEVTEDEPMALVRARGLHGDVWIGMRARPEIDLGALPRRTQPGMVIELDAVSGATFRLTDGSGRMTEGPLEQGEQLLLTSTGEWLLEVTRDRRELARMPLYVGISPPEDPVLAIAGEPPPLVDAADVDVATRRLLRHVRDVYVLDAWHSDPSLDIAASKIAAASPSDTTRILNALGYERTEVVVWACDDVTIENCIDKWIWDPRRRATLFDPTLDVMGLHASLDARGIHLTLVLGRTG
jgi:hypothetical protein